LEGFGEEVDCAEVARLEGQMEAGLRSKGRGTKTPGYAGIDLRTDLHLLDAQRADAHAGSFASGYDELAHAAPNEG
jgi:hypothetical protein